MKKYKRAKPKTSKRAKTKTPKIAKTKTPNKDAARLIEFIKIIYAAAYYMRTHKENV